ncbi:hypothetical protein LGN43_10600 [Burkholderia multivorans]|nr:hypothetical protein [Burkholderia multivorans]
MSSIGHVARKEEAAAGAVGQAESRLKEVSTPGMQRAAEIKLLEAREELDLIQVAKKSLLSPYRGRFSLCTSCRNPFNDEGSYLAHWQYSRGRVRCVSTPSTLKVLGFVADEHDGEFILRHPVRQIE